MALNEHMGLIIEISCFDITSSARQPLAVVGEDAADRCHLTCRSRATPTKRTVSTTEVRLAEQ